MSVVVQVLEKTLRSLDWIDEVAEPVQQAVQTIYQSGGKAGQKIADFLHGTWLGHPLHPILTDIPVGAWTAAVVLDVMASNSGSRRMRRRFQKGADVAVAVGVAGAAGAAVSGITDWQHLSGESRRTGFIHALLNTAALILFIGSMFSRSRRDRSRGQMFALAGYSIAGVSAYLGGDLVFRQKIGVNHAPKGIETPRFEPVIDVSALPENQLTRANLHNIPLVILRRGDQVFALAETCAHLGGPLADGKLGTDEQGHPTVTCPWHGSTFDLTSGRIVNGPATYPQPCFEARMKNGKVEVRYRLRENDHEQYVMNSA